MSKRPDRRESCAKYYAANRERLKANSRARRETKLEEVRGAERDYNNRHKAERKRYAASYRAENQAAISRQIRSYYSENPDKLFAARLRYVLKNKGIIAARNAERHARKRKAYVPWADQDVIRSYYAAAQVLTRLTGEPWHVDHIIPLIGKTVSGLHHQDNLRVIRGVENMRKRARYVQGEHELRLFA